MTTPYDIKQTLNWLSTASTNANNKSFGAQDPLLLLTGGIPTGVSEGLRDAGENQVDGFVMPTDPHTIVQYLLIDGVKEVRIQDQDPVAQTATLQVNNETLEPAPYVTLDGTEQGAIIGYPDDRVIELERIIDDTWTESQKTTYLTSKEI